MHKLMPLDVSIWKLEKEVEIPFNTGVNKLTILNAVQKT